MPKQPTDSSGASARGTLPILLDTHIAIWLADGSPRLSPSTVALLEGGFQAGSLCVSPISAWEIGLLVSRKRLDLGEHPLVWFSDFVHRFHINILDLTPEIAINSSYVPGKFHGDPADRILVATALYHSTVILSADKAIVSYGKQGFVQIIPC